VIEVEHKISQHSQVFAKVRGLKLGFNSHSNILNIIHPDL